jgi:hypothetical protein
MSQPLIVCFEDKYLKGLTSLTDAAELRSGELLPIGEAFARQWARDAHFIQYALYEPPVPSKMQFRINTVVLPQLAAHGAEVLLSVFGVDIDNPEHAGHTPESVDRMHRLVYELPDYLKPQWFYTTKHGCRFVYHLLEPIPALDAPPRHRGLLKLLAKYGVTADPACSDWTRLFRLPQVVRND